jgi:hypothetical protein
MSLTRARRWKAGWLLGLVYLLCVLAPPMSFALPGSYAAAPCLGDEHHVAGVVHVHNEMPMQHVHKAGHVHDHDHSGGHSVASSDGDQSALNAKSVPEKAPHASDGECCGLMCVTALPATLIDIVKPSVPTALCESRGDRKVTDNAPPRHYRPPIS